MLFFTFFRFFCYKYITFCYKEGRVISPTESITSMLLITAIVVRMLGNIRSSVLSPARCHNKPPTVNLRATNSPSAGLSPNIGLVSYTLGCFKPL